MSRPAPYPHRARALAALSSLLHHPPALGVGLRLLPLLIASWSLVFPLARAARAGTDLVRYERLPRVTKTLAVVPFRNYLADPKTIFRPESEPLAMDKALAATLDYLTERLNAEDDVMVIRGRELRDRLTMMPRYREGILLAREWFNLGVDHFKALRLDRALENLDRAESIYLEVFQDVVEPFALATLELYRGMTLAEKGTSELAHVALKQMFFFNPWIRFQPGYYAPSTEQALRSALVDFQLTFVHDIALLSTERAERFMEELDLDGIVHGYIERDEHGDPMLHVVIFERSAGRVTFHDKLRLTGTPADLEAVDRLATRWLSCAEWGHPKLPRTAQDASVFIDVGGAYGLSLSRPTRRIYHNIGVTMGGTFQILKSFDVYARLHVMTTLPDPNKDLLRSSTNTRFTVGVGFTFRSRHLRFYVHPGLDIAYVGRLRWTTDPDCKFWRDFEEADRPSVCPASHINELDQPFLIGGSVATGLDVFLTPELYLDVQFAATAYFLPVDNIDVLNFPLTWNLGMGYAF